MSGKISGVFRVHDSLGVKRTRTADQPGKRIPAKELMKPGADPWALGNLPSDDASAKPTPENVQAYYTNALRSSGDKAEAIMRTKKMFDLAGLDVDEKGAVRSFKVADEIVGPLTLTPAEINRRNRNYWEPEKSGSAGTADESAPPTEAPRGNAGNAVYVLTLPSGEYDAEDDGDTMKIIRVAEGRDPEVVASVPKGTYRLEAGRDGHQHLFRLPDDGTPERVALTDTPTRVGDHMPAALKRMNENMQKFYAGLARRTGT